jgi:hypothetical protein
MSGPVEAVVSAGEIDVTLHRASTGDRQSQYRVDFTYFNAASRSWVSGTLGQILPSLAGPVELADLLAIPAPLPDVPDALAQAIGAAAAAANSAAVAADEAEDGQASAVAAAASAAAAALFAPAYFADYAAMMTDTTAWPVGTRLNDRSGNAWQVVASGEHFTRADGVKLRALEVGGGYDAAAFGLPAPGAGTGGRDNARFAAAVAALAGKTLRLGDGPYHISAYPPGLDDVFIEGSPFVNFTGLPIPMHTPVYTGNQQVALAACALRYYAAGVVSPGSPAAWYILSAKSGAWHEPVLAGPVLASGAGSVLLKINIGDFGLDEETWTPAGLVCGPDEGFVADGVIFGASVETDEITVTGSFTTPRTCMVTWTATGVGAGTLTGSNAPYIFTTNADGIVSGWTGSGTARCLRLFREPLTQERKAFPGGGVTPMIGCRRSAASSLGVFGNYRAAGTQTAGGTVYSYYDVFVDRQSDGTQITDASNVSFTLTIMDPMARPPAFVFNQDPGAGSNIWIVGVFRRRPDALPA